MSISQNCFCLLQHIEEGVKNNLFMLIKVSNRRAFPVLGFFLLFFRNGASAMFSGNDLRLKMFLKRSAIDNGL